MELNVYGDNILECEIASKLIAEAFDGNLQFDFGSLVTPKYSIIKDNKKIIDILIFPGYGNRWPFNVLENLTIYGARINESPDAFITKVKNGVEIPVIIYFF